MQQHADPTGLVATVALADKFSNALMQPPHPLGNLMAAHRFRQPVKRKHIGGAEAVDSLAGSFLNGEGKVLLNGRAEVQNNPLR